MTEILLFFPVTEKNKHMQYPKNKWVQMIFFFHPSNIISSLITVAETWFGLQFMKYFSRTVRIQGQD